jgi:hypothetical protein
MQKKSYQLAEIAPKSSLHSNRVGIGKIAYAIAFNCSHEIAHWTHLGYVTIIFEYYQHRVVAFIVCNIHRAFLCVDKNVGKGQSHERLDLNRVFLRSRCDAWMYAYGPEECNQQSMQAADSLRERRPFERVHKSPSISSAHCLLLCKKKYKLKRIHKQCTKIRSRAFVVFENWILKAKKNIDKVRRCLSQF